MSEGPADARRPPDAAQTTFQRLAGAPDIGKAAAEAAKAFARGEG